MLVAEQDSSKYQCYTRWFDPDWVLNPQSSALEGSCPRACYIIPLMWLTNTIKPGHVWCIFKTNPFV